MPLRQLFLILGNRVLVNILELLIDALLETHQVALEKVIDLSFLFCLQLTF